jgi:hypothetical protein
MVQLFRVGPVQHSTPRDDVMLGAPVSNAHATGRLSVGTKVSVRVGWWPSGLYFARLTASGRVGFAPFVVQPDPLRHAHVAVVLPTRTWQAYNLRDDDADGKPDTWYGTQGSRQARLGRPFLHRDVPPKYRRYDARFLIWLQRTGKEVDVLSQADVHATSGSALARRYELIVFPGHHEYVTKREYDNVRAYRDRGGNLAFLSANNFFWRARLRSGVMTRVAKWRDVGRPEAALVGVQYFASDRVQRRGPWRVRRKPAAAWLFAGIDLGPRREFSTGDTEFDHVTSSSPRAIEIVAEIRDVLGPGRTAHMTYDETRRGARVFAAGAFTLAGRLYERDVRRLLENLWRRLSRP